MASIPLQDYIAQVETMLGEEQYDRTIAYCQHALRTHPRCVDFYRMMGQACLETGRPDDAADMFRRVLGADPQNFTARVGLGVVAEGISAFDEAAWQWERALELEPNHTAIRQELQQLRERMGETERTARIKLTRTALGYIYMRDEQYNRAAKEFRAVLQTVSNGGAGEHDRFDLQVALAEALYRGGHRREAAELCRQVLKTLPNALKPNLILSNIYQDTGRSEEAAPLAERARLLDPADRVAEGLLESPPPAAPDAVLELPTSGPLVALGGTPAAPAVERTTDAGGGPVAPIAREGASPDLPEWLRALRGQTPAEPNAPAGGATIAEAEEPEWLKALRANAPDAVTPVTALTPDESTPARESDVPEWVLALRAEQSSEPVASADEPLPEWMDETRAPDAAESAAPPAEGAPPAEVAAEEPPASAAATGGEPESEATERVEAVEMPDWLKALHTPATEQTLRAEPPDEHGEAGRAEAAPRAAAREVPDWLEDLRTEPPSERAEPKLAAEPLEPNVYLDDASAPPSIETQPALTGEAEHAARLDLARMLVDLDLNEALDQYAQLAGASPAVRQAALSDLTALADSHRDEPRVQAVLQQLGGTAEPATAPVSEAVPELDEMVAADATAAPHTHAEPIVSEETSEAISPLADAESVSTAETLPVVDESMAAPTTVQPREASVYLDDSSAPPSIETQETPHGEAEYRALLELARALMTIDSGEALDTYARLVGAGEAVRDEAVGDLSALSPSEPRVQELINALRGAAPAMAPTPTWVGEAQASMVSARSPDSHAEPIVEEETMLAGASSTVETPQPALPVVDEEIMDELPLPAKTAPLPDLAIPSAAPVAAPPVEQAAASTAEAAVAEPTVYLDDASAPPSIETLAAPTGADEHAARLDLARTLREFDVPEALAQYRFLVENDSPLLAQAIDDLSALSDAPAAPREAHLLLADALTRAGRLAEAIALYRKMV